MTKHLPLFDAPRQGSHPRSDDYDIVFAGAGLSGLSLAVRLCSLPDPPRMLLVDPRCGTVRDRTWCHWEINDHPFAPAVTHRWHNWVVSDDHHQSACHSPVYPYVCIPSDRFFDLACQKISDTPHVDFLTGVSVAAINNHGDHALIQLSDGRMVRTSWVFDSRPLQNDRAPWRQIFSGLELHSPAAKLDTSTVTLMNFVSAGAQGIRFFYVLPLASDTALVEDTWLVPAAESPVFKDEFILSYAYKKLAPVEWQIRHREQGNLPLGLKPIKRAPVSNGSTPRIIPWGTPAGALRASSGYAFSRIQNASDKLAVSWKKNRRFDSVGFSESFPLDWMDRVFLRVMTRHSQRVPDFFTRLFKRTPTDSLVRFMESKPSIKDIFHVMSSLPPLPFVSSVFR